MARLLAAAVVIVAVLPCLASEAGQSRLLTFEDRVTAQEAIERIYYSHQIGATKPFDDVIPRPSLVRKVEQTLKFSAALQSLWGIRITLPMLEHEADQNDAEHSNAAAPARSTLLPHIAGCCRRRWRSTGRSAGSSHRRRA